MSSSVKNDKLHLIENSADFLDRPLPNRKNRSLESIHLKTVKKDKKPDKTPAPKIPVKEEAKENKEQPYSSLVISSSSIHVGPTSAEERQRTGRYLAVGLTLIMLFIAFYHTIMRQTPVLAGLLPPAIIMVLYILWLLYFAKKRKRIQITTPV